jgi:hypothetical protein
MRLARCITRKLKTTHTPRGSGYAECGGSRSGYGFFPWLDYRLIPPKPLNCFNLQQIAARDYFGDQFNENISPHSGSFL